MPEKIVIGLTGPIGAGKSAVASLMRNRGYRLIVADAIGHQLLLRSHIKTEIRKLFGDEVFNENGEIVRVSLAAIVFADEDKIKLFNGIVHPPLLKELKKRCDNEPADVVLEAALLFEWGDKVYYDVSVCVYAPEELRKRRTAGSYSEKDFLRRQKTQLPPSRKMEIADIVIMNDGTLAELDEKIDRLTEYLNTFKGTGKLPSELTL